jgi:hypothetical protein
MQYYKSIEMNDFNLIKQITLQYAIEKNHLIDKGTFRFINWDEYTLYCPQILTAFSMYDLTPVTGYFHVSHGRRGNDLHIDYQSNELPMCRVNVPILNCEGSVTEFYTGGNYLPYNAKSNGSYSFLMVEDFSLAIKVAEVEILKPTVLRIQEPHRVVPNLDAVPRITLSLIMNRDPVFLLDE